MEIRASITAFSVFPPRGAEGWLRLSSMRIKVGRLVGLMVHPEGFELSSDDSSFERQRTLRLAGSRKDDPDKIARWIETEMLRA